MTIQSSVLPNVLPINATQTTDTVKLQAMVERADASKASSDSLDFKSSTANSDLLQNVIQVFQNMSFDTSSLTSATNTSGEASSNTVTSLQKFLYNLYQTLTKGSGNDTDQTSQVDNDTQVDSDIQVNAVMIPYQSAYNNPPEIQLESLIKSLETNTDKNTVLQKDFANLVQSMSDVSANTDANSANLQNFLKQLATSMGNPNVLQSSVGNLFYAVA